MLSQIRMFLVALEEGSLNRAAARLRMSQSALSRQMQALEAELGGALFERTTTGIRPTDAGYALAKSMPDLLTRFDTCVSEVRRLARGQTDLIRIGYLGSASQIFLDPALAALKKSTPEAKARLLDLTPGEQITALRAGEIDLGIIGPEGATLTTEFYTRTLATLPMLAGLPEEHPLAARKTLALADLRGQTFISAREEDLPGRDRWTAQICRRAGFRPKFSSPAESMSQAFSMVITEDAIALVPGYLSGQHLPGIALVPIQDEDATWELIVVWQRGRTSKAVHALLGHLGEVAERACVEAKGTGAS
jgi:DNA-binding transcriptional LysR family regulator